MTEVRKTYDHLTYAEAAAILNSPRVKAKGEKKIGNNTWMSWDRSVGYVDDIKAINIDLYGHTILRLHPNGDTEFFHRGYQTVTTQRRMNECAPRGFSVGGTTELSGMVLRPRDAGTWWVYPPYIMPEGEDPSDEERRAAWNRRRKARVRFVDGIKITAAGQIISPEGETTETRVTYRRWTYDSKSVIALLWDVDHRPGMVMSYMHIGQHSEADPGLMRNGHTEPADMGDPDVAALREELEGRGYILTEIKRTPKHW